MDPLSTAADQTMPVGVLVVMMGTLLLMAVVLVLMGVRGGQGRIRPNGHFGIRTGYTFSSDFAWYTVHRVAARWSVAGGLACLPGLVLLPVATTPNGQIAAVLAPMGLSLLLLFFGTWRAHKVSRAREAPEAGRAGLS
jgi:uncharacterized membrane protein